MSDLPTTRAKALSLGLTRYFTGKPCKHGHVAELYARAGSCVECARESRRQWHKDNPEKVREQQRKWHAENADKERERKRKWKAANREKVRESRRQRAEANPEKERERQRKWDAANPEKLRERDRRYREANRDKLREHSRQYRETNPEKLRERDRRYREANRDKRREKIRQWSAANRDKCNAVGAARRARKINATPPWVNMAAIEAIYAECARVSAETGIEHHVDHIVPLKGRTVCGLHVETNLQVLTASENIKKGNRLCA